MEKAQEARDIEELDGMLAPSADVMCEVCPSRRVLALIADKWTMLILSFRTGRAAMPS